MVAAAVRTVFAQPDAGHVRSQLAEVTGMLRPQFPDVASMLADAAEDLLAFTALPPGRRCGRRTRSSGSTG